MSKKSTVVLLRCDSYDPNAVYDAVQRGVSLLGSMDAFFKRDERILLKPNLLKSAQPDQAVTTHPSVFAAVGRLLQENGFTNLCWGDSPGPGQGKALEKAARVSEILQASEELGIPQGDFESGVKVLFPQGRIANSFILCKGVTQADALINLCKMKTHALEKITGAVKNTYGCVYGLNKGTGHAKYPDADSFAKMLADLNMLVKPRLHIMDGIVAMEGNGPGSGDPVPMNLLLLSSDPVALDSVYCRLVNLDPAEISTNLYGEAYGVGYWREEDIEIVSADGVLGMDEVFALYGNPKFRIPDGRSRFGALNKLAVFSRLTSSRPVIVRSRCVKCAVCVESCPLEKKAIAMSPKRGGYPVYDYAKCIRCYCCQELCPHKAIEVATPLTAKTRRR